MNIKSLKIIFMTCCIITALYNTTGTYAMEIQGGVSFNVNSAREYVQAGQPDGVTIPDNYYQFQANNVDKVVYSKNNEGDIIGITVRYMNEPTKAYIYNRNKNLIYVDKYDKPTDIYPHRGYRYDLDGNLILTSLTVSKNEMFRFSADGHLIAHSINGIIYDEKGNIIGSGK